MGFLRHNGVLLSLPRTCHVVTSSSPEACRACRSSISHIQYVPIGCKCLCLQWQDHAEEHKGPTVRFTELACTAAGLRSPVQYERRRWDCCRAPDNQSKPSVDFRLKAHGCFRASSVHTGEMFRVPTNDPTTKCRQQVIPVFVRVGLETHMVTVVYPSTIKGSISGYCLLSVVERWKYSTRGQRSQPCPAGTFHLLLSGGLVPPLPRVTVHHRPSHNMSQGMGKCSKPQS